MFGLHLLGNQDMGPHNGLRITYLNIDKNKIIIIIVNKVLLIFHEARRELEKEYLQRSVEERAAARGGGEKMV
jgi:hypothetical protein